MIYGEIEQKYLSRNNQDDFAERIVSVVCDAFRIDFPEDIPWNDAVERVKSILYRDSQADGYKDEWGNNFCIR